MAEIASIVYSPIGDEQKHPVDHFQRVPLTEAALIAGYGIEGDRKGGRRNRQLNVMASEVMDGLATEGYMTAPGALGEQITIRGLDLIGLPTGTRVRLGDDAVIEVVKPRTGCERFAAIQGLPQEPTINRLGVMARVVMSGLIRVGDPVALLPEPAFQSS